jgi:hypothetical protein
MKSILAGAINRLAEREKIVIEAVLRVQAEGVGELDWDARSTPAWSGAAARRRGPQRGSRRPPAGAGAVTGWADTKLHTIGDGRGPNLATGLTRARTPLSPAGRAGGGHAGGPPWWPRVAPHPGGPSDRGQGLQPGEPGGVAGPPHPHTIPSARTASQPGAAGVPGAAGRRPLTGSAIAPRNQVERLRHRCKQVRAVASRCDTLADRYAATVAVADSFIWLRARADQSRGESTKHTLEAVSRDRRLTACTGRTGGRRGRRRHGSWIPRRAGGSRRGRAPSAPPRRCR